QLAPDQSAAIAALRSTGRMVRQIAAVSITTAIIAQSAAPVQLQARGFIVFAALLLACLPVIARVHEHRGSWGEPPAPGTGNTRLNARCEGRARRTDPSPGQAAMAAAGGGTIELAILK